MSKRSEAKHSIVVAIQKMGGSGNHRAAVRRTANDLVEWLHAQGRSVGSLKNLTLGLVRDYLEFRAGGGNGSSCECSPATLRNLLSHIRKVMQLLGADPDTLQITPPGVGLEPRNRGGTKVPLTPEQYEQVLERASELNETGLLIMLRLQRLAVAGDAGRPIPLMAHVAANATDAATRLLGSVRVSRGDTRVAGWCLLAPLQP